jgi:hypothetical protein
MVRPDDGRVDHLKRIRDRFDIRQCSEQDDAR